MKFLCFLGVSWFLMLGCLVLPAATCAENLLINDDTTGGVIRHGSPAVARCDQGSVVVWTDERYVTRDIYYQRYNVAGQTIGANTKVNDLSVVSSGFRDVRVAMSVNGSFVVVWAEGPHNTTIVAQLFDPNGQPVGGNMLVSDYASRANQPEIGMNSGGEFVVVWQRTAEDALARVYYANGNPKGDGFQVNEPTSSGKAASPSVAMFEDGGFQVVWEDNRNDNEEPGSNYDIYMQRYLANGSPVGANLRVNDDVPGPNQWSPSIACDKEDRFVVVWDDRRNAELQVMSQLYDTAAEAVGANFRADEDYFRANTVLGGPRADWSDSGKYVVVWNSQISGLRRGVYGRWFDHDGLAQGNTFGATDSILVPDIGMSIYPQCAAPGIAVDESGAATMVWLDSRHADGELFAGSQSVEIFAQRFGADGSPDGGNVRVPDDHAVGAQNRVAVASVPGTGFIAVWHDSRKSQIVSGDWDLFAQLLDQDGAPLGTNFLVATDRIYPSVAADSENGIIIASTSRDEGKVFVNRFDNLGQSTGAEIRVDQDVQNRRKWLPAIAALGSEGFVVTWRQVDALGSSVFAQRFSSSGIPIGDNLPVSPGGYSSTCLVPGVGFLVAWLHQTSYMYMHLFDFNGSPTGSPIGVTEEPVQLQIPDVSSNSSGIVAIVWTQLEDIHCRLYGPDGVAAGPAFVVNDDDYAVQREPREPRVAATPAGEFLVTWTAGPEVTADIYCQRLSSTGEKLGANQMVNDPSTSSYWQEFPSVACSDNRAFIGWIDNRRGKSWDVFGRSFALTTTGVDDGDETLLPTEFMLGQNYPNPFNPSTTIEYMVPKRSQVQIVIYNTLGQAVRSLLSAVQSPGTHTITWDGSDDSGRTVATGIYFYRIEVGDTVGSRKMMLLK